MTTSERSRRSPGARPDLAEGPAEREGADVAERALHVGEVDRGIGRGAAGGERAPTCARTLTAGRAAADPAIDLANMQRALGDVGTFAFRWAFGEVWSRPELSRRDRSLVVIAILAAMGQGGELAFHVPAGLNHGLTRAEIEEIMVHLGLYAGFPRAVDGVRAARAAFAKIDERAAR